MGSGAGGRHSKDECGRICLQCRRQLSMMIWASLSEEKISLWLLFHRHFADKLHGVISSCQAGIFEIGLSVMLLPKNSPAFYYPRPTGQEGCILGFRKSAVFLELITARGWH